MLLEVASLVWPVFPHNVGGANVAAGVEANATKDSAEDSPALQSSLRSLPCGAICIAIFEHILLDGT